MSEIIGLRLPEKLYKVVEKEAKETGNSMQAVIRQRLSESYRQSTGQQTENAGANQELIYAQ